MRQAIHLEYAMPVGETTSRRSSDDPTAATAGACSLLEHAVCFYQEYETAPGEKGCRRTVGDKARQATGQGKRRDRGWEATHALLSGRPSQWLLSGHPSQWLLSGRPSQWLLSGRPSQWLLSGHPGQWLLSGRPSHSLLSSSAEARLRHG